MLPCCLLQPWHSFTAAAAVTSGRIARGTRSPKTFSSVLAALARGLLSSAPTTPRVLAAGWPLKLFTPTISHAGARMPSRMLLSRPRVPAATPTQFFARKALAALSAVLACKLHLHSRTCFCVPVVVGCAELTLVVNPLLLSFAGLGTSTAAPRESARPAEMRQKKLS